MAIRLKIARTEQEIDDALWVRHEVFVNEDGKFGGKRLPDDRIVDPFDAFPSVENIVAYKDRHPIATMRLAMETPLGLPADRLSDFTPYRKKVRAEYRSGRQRGAGPVFASAGMLAVRGPWRSRRDVIRAMLKIAGGVFRSWGATHILAAVKNETVGMYGRLGFKRLAESERRWVEEVGDYVTPLAAAAEDCYRRAFDDIPKTPLSLFQESFGRLFLRAGETLFHEGDPGDEAFVIDTGTIRISRKTPDGVEFTLAHLTRGGLFGELVLVDRLPRSATAVAMTDAELMTLDRKSFMDQLYDEPKRLRLLLEIFSDRIRRMDDLAMVLAYSSKRDRLDFALRRIRDKATPDPRRPGTHVFKGSAEDLATSAAIDKAEVTRFLDSLHERGQLEYDARQIRFLEQHTARPAGMVHANEGGV